MEVMTRGVVTDARMEKGTLVIVLQAEGTRGRKRMITCFRRGMTALLLRDQIKLGQTLIVKGSPRKRVTALYADSILIWNPQSGGMPEKPGDSDESVRAQEC